MPVIHCKNEAEWKAERAKSIGASEVPTILGLNPFETELALYFRRLGLAPEIEEAEWMDWGHRLEGAIGTRWLESHPHVNEARAGNVLANSPYAIQRQDDTPFMHATPDFVYIWTVGDTDHLGVVQIKTVGSWMAHHWRDDDGCQLLPEYVYAQVQSEIYNTHADCGAVACLIGGQRYLEFDVPRDEDKIAEIIEACHEFDRRLREEDPPPATERDLDTVKARWPESVDEKVVSLDWNTQIAAQNWIADKDHVTWHTDRVAEHEANIKLAMGDADKGVFPDGSGFTWRTNKRGARVFRRFERGK